VRAIALIGIFSLFATASAAAIDSEGANALRASDLYRRGNLASATKVLEEGTRQFPESAQLHFMLGNAYFRAGKWDTAASQYQVSESLRPNHPDTPLNLGYAFYRAGRTDEAVEAWRRSVALSPYDALPYLSLGVGLAAQRKPAESRGCVVKAISLDANWKRRVSRDVRWSPEMVSALEQIATRTRAGGL
jgi:tetratricopeptide (TPR) repeat protein